MVNKSAEQLQTSPIALFDNLDTVDTESLYVGQNNISIESKSSEIGNSQVIFYNLNSSHFLLKTFLVFIQEFKQE